MTDNLSEMPSLSDLNDEPTQEEAYRAWCSEFYRDPEDARSAIEYEEWWANDMDDLT